ncbi:6575_t:CDS:2, partial [Acaulospora morrowiae]
MNHEKYVLLLFLVNLASISSASTLCNQIVHSVSHVAFGNYLSFSSGTFLTFFSTPSKDDKSFSAKLKRLVIRTAVIQLMGVLALMTFMTTRFFILNSLQTPELLNGCSTVMYVFCVLNALTQIVPDSGYLSSALLLSGSFALGNVVHSAFYLIFPRKEWEVITTYEYKTQAQYDFKAEPENKNILSFTQGEVLDIVDKNGDLWIARKSNGTVGIIQSDY